MIREDDLSQIRIEGLDPRTLSFDFDKTFDLFLQTNVTKALDFFLFFCYHCLI